MLCKRYLFALIQKQKLIFVSMAMMFALAFSMFVGSSFALDNYRVSIDNFFTGCRYPSAVITTGPVRSSAFDCLKSVEGVKDFDVRFSSVFNFTADGAYYHVLLNTYSDDDFSGFAYMSEQVDGDYPGIYIDQQFSDKHNLQIGDTVSVGKNGKFCSCTVSRIILKPENLNYRALGDTATDNIGYGVIYMRRDDFSSLLHALQINTFGIDSNQVLIDIDPSCDAQAVLDRCCDALPDTVKIEYSLLAKDTPSALLREELTGQFVAISETTPLLFLIIVCMVYILFLVQIIKKQSREIGIFLSLGYRTSSVYGLFSAFTCCISLLSVLFGGILSYFIAKTTYGLYQNNVYLPSWTAKLSVGKLLLCCLWIFAAGQLACLISSLAYRKASPTDAMALPYLSGIRLGKKAENSMSGTPVVTRLAVNAIVQNLRNFFVIVIGLAASFVLIHSAFSMYFSLREYVNFTYEHQNNYDARVVSLNDNSDSAFDELKENTNVTRLQVYESITADITYEGKTRHTAVIGFPPDNDMLQFKDAASGEPIRIPEEGIVLDIITAKALGVKPGDLVELCNQKLEVAAITALYREQYQTVSMRQMQLLDAEKSEIALVTVADKEAFEEFCAFSEKDLCPIFTSNFKEMELGFKTSLSVLINIFVVAVILLGFVVVVTVSKMTLEKQKRVISILRCQGMHIIEVSNYWAVQMIAQLLLAYLIGLPLATFAGKTFVGLLCSDISYYPYIFDFRIYLLSFLFIIAFSVVSHLVIVFLIGKFNLPENVQSRE